MKLSRYVASVFFCGLLASPLIEVGCASTDTLAEGPMRTGANMQFQASYARTVRAATAALFDVKMPITKITNQSDGTVILTAQHLNTMTDGDVGRIFIDHSPGDATAVYVVVQNRLSGQHRRDFAGPYFDALQTELQHQ